MKAFIYLLVSISLVVSSKTQAQDTQPKLSLSLKVKSKNFLSLSLHNDSYDTISVRTKVYINDISKRYRHLLFLYKSKGQEQNDWKIWERHYDPLPYIYNDGSVSLPPKRSITILGGLSSFENCYVKAILSTVYRTSDHTGFIQLESNSVYIWPNP